MSKQNKKAIIIVLVIVLAYVVVFFDQRSVGRATFDSDADVATEFAKEIEDVGGQVVPFPAQEEVIQPEAPSTFPIENLFYLEPTTFDLPRAREFTAAVEKIAAGEMTELPISSNIANLFVQARLTVLTTKDGAAFLRALKSKMR